MIVAFWGAGSAFAQSTPVAPAPAPVEIRFDIERILVEGNTLLPQGQVEGIAARFTGKQLDFGDLQRALEALELAYRERGYSAVQVFLPEQELDKGTVKLRVIESRIRKLTVQGNKFFDEANIRASLPSLREGAPPNGLHVDVADGIIVVTNQAGTQDFRVGEFGYVQSFTTPPAVVPPSQGIRVVLPAQALNQTILGGRVGSGNNLECQIQ